MRFHLKCASQISNRLLLTVVIQLLKISVNSYGLDEDWLNEMLRQPELTLIKKGQQRDAGTFFAAGLNCYHRCGIIMTWTHLSFVSLSGFCAKMVLFPRNGPVEITLKPTIVLTR